MDFLISGSNQLVHAVRLDFKRSLIDQIQWDWRLIGIRGARGVGKTTMLLQHMKRKHPIEKAEAVYLSLDNIYFLENRLWDVVEVLQGKGYRYFYLDEVHKYPHWAREIKNVYDQFPYLHVVFTGSSIIEMNKLDVDLSRRAVVYDLPVLSFREYLALTGVAHLPVVKWEALLNNHVAIGLDILQTIKPLQHLPRYLEIGCYPFFMENTTLFAQRLAQTIQLVVETDLAFVEGIQVRQTRKILQLLQVVAQSVPFSINVSKVAEKVQIERNTLTKYLHYLEKSAIISFLNAPETNLSALQKPEKLYLENTNLSFALAPDNVNKGNLRETFFFNQVRTILPVHFAQQGDFLVNEQCVFEIGGIHKTFEQVKHIPDAYLALDDLELGNGRRIPLWMFGLLY